MNVLYSESELINCLPPLIAVTFVVKTLVHLRTPEIM